MSIRQCIGTINPHYLETSVSLLQFGTDVGLTLPISASAILNLLNNRLWCAFISNDFFDPKILLCSSINGVDWTDNTKTQYTAGSIFAPQLAAFLFKRWCAFIADPEDRAILVGSSADNVNWTDSINIRQSTQTAPSLAVFNNRLWCAFLANNPDDRAILVCSSADGVNWTDFTNIRQSSIGAPSLAVFNNRLWCAFLADNPNDPSILVCSSADGVNWTDFTNIRQSSIQTPALLAMQLYGGQICPRYIVLALVYAPPGTNGGKSSSQVEYGSGSTLGTKISISDSFKEGYSVSASVGGSVGVGTTDIININLGSSANFSASKTKTDSSSLEIKKNRDYSIKVYGSSTDGIDHNRDVFYLWLNPRLDILIDSQNNLRWQLAVDGPDINIQYVYAGWLKDPTLMETGLYNNLKNHGLTTADFAQILALDPFTSSPYTIEENRFQRTGQTFPYIGPYSANDPVPTMTYKQANSTTSAVSKETQAQTEPTSSISAGILALSLKASYTITMTHKSTSETTEASSEYSNVTIGGPAYGYTGPTNLAVYWDNIFKSFMFAFVDESVSSSGTLLDALGKPLPYQPITLDVKGRILQTFTDSRGNYRFHGAYAGTGKLSVGNKTFQVPVGPNVAKQTLRV